MSNRDRGPCSGCSCCCCCCCFCYPSGTSCYAWHMFVYLRQRENATWISTSPPPLTPKSSSSAAPMLATTPSLIASTAAAATAAGPSTQLAQQASDSSRQPVHHPPTVHNGRMVLSFQRTSPQLNRRRHLVDWATLVCRDMALAKATLHHAVRLMDLFMDGHYIAEAQLYLVCLVCISLASKYGEQDGSQPRISTLNKYVQNRFLHCDYVKVEMMVMSYFNFNVFLPTVFHYLQLFIELGIGLFAGLRKDATTPTVQVKGRCSIKTLSDCSEWQKNIRRMMELRVTPEQLLQRPRAEKIIRYFSIAALQNDVFTGVSRYLLASAVMYCSHYVLGLGYLFLSSPVAPTTSVQVLNTENAAHPQWHPQCMSVQERRCSTATDASFDSAVADLSLDLDSSSDYTSSASPSSSSSSDETTLSSSSSSGVPASDAMDRIVFSRTVAHLMMLYRSDYAAIALTSALPPPIVQVNQIARQPAESTGLPIQQQQRQPTDAVTAQPSVIQAQPASSGLSSVSKAAPKVAPYATRGAVRNRMIAVVPPQTRAPTTRAAAAAAAAKLLTDTRNGFCQVGGVGGGNNSPKICPPANNHQQSSAVLPTFSGVGVPTHQTNELNIMYSRELQSQIQGTNSVINSSSSPTVAVASIGTKRKAVTRVAALNIAAQPTASTSSVASAIPPEVATDNSINCGHISGFKRRESRSSSGGVAAPATAVAKRGRPCGSASSISGGGVVAGRSRASNVRQPIRRERQHAMMTRSLSRQQQQQQTTVATGEN